MTERMWVRVVFDIDIEACPEEIPEDAGAGSAENQADIDAWYDKLCDEITKRSDVMLSSLKAAGYRVLAADTDHIDAAPGELMLAAEESEPSHGQSKDET